MPLIPYNLKLITRPLPVRPIISAEVFEFIYLNHTVRGKQFPGARFALRLVYQATDLVRDEIFYNTEERIDAAGSL